MPLNITLCTDKSTKQNYLTSNDIGLRNEELHENREFHIIFTKLINETINKYQELCYTFYKDSSIQLNGSGYQGTASGKCAS